MQPSRIAAQTEIQKDGKLLTFLMKAVAVVRIQNHIEVDPDRPTIAAGNHQSLLDVFMAAAFCYQANVGCRLLVQARYFDNKLAGRWLRRIGCIPLSSDNKDEAFAEVRAALERRELVGIMPEGRLTKPERRNPQVGPFRVGGCPNWHARPERSCARSPSIAAAWPGLAANGQRFVSEIVRSSP